MLSFQHILFPVDLSPQCLRAAPFVRAAAKRFGANITMLHVIEIPGYGFGAMGAESFAVTVDLPDLVQSRKAEFANFLSVEFQDARVERVIYEGDPAQMIEQCVRERATDLIMMPTHGTGRFRQLLLGSVTAKVLHDLTCPVWTAAHTEGPATHPGEIRTMLCALELGAESAPLLQWAAGLAEVYGAKLRIVHAVPGSDGPPGEYFDTELDGFLMNMAREEIAKIQEEAHTSFEVCIGRGDVANVVRETAVHHGADLVIIGRGLIQKTMGRLRTDAYSVIREAPCPVLSVAAPPKT